MLELSDIFDPVPTGQYLELFSDLSSVNHTRTLQLL